MYNEYTYQCNAKSKHIMKKPLANKYPLGFFPTPLHKLHSLSQSYPDYDIYIKRDDQTGLASGGNKTRKLEYLIWEAIDNHCNAIFTTGAQQSNHCRQTAAACAIAGLECHLVVGGNAPQTYQGNLLLSHLLGAHIHFLGDNPHEKSCVDFAPFIKTLSPDTSPCIIPYGGSNVTGALGFVEAVGELKQQLTEQNILIDYIFFASSSGATQAGLLLGLALYQLDITLVPIKIEKNETAGIAFEQHILDIVLEGKRLLHIEKNYTLDDIMLNDNYNQAAYGVLTDRERYAMHTMARNEGILLDPVYTGRACYGMIDCLKEQKIPPHSSVLFWHTGGLPAVFDYASGL